MQYNVRYATDHARFYRIQVQYINLKIHEMWFNMFHIFSATSHIIRGWTALMTSRRLCHSS